MKFKLPTPQLPSRTRRAWWAAWLISSLLLSQALGQLHAVQHGGKQLTGPAVEHQHDPDQSQVTDATQAERTTQIPQEAHKHHGVIEQLFSSHSTVADCRLYDQASTSNAMPSVAVAMLPLVVPSFVVAIFQGEALARWTALFDARGPPLTV